jgi:hypothetical protein
MTSQGSASGRFTRAIKQRNLFGAEMAMRELGTPSLRDALDYLDLLAEVKPEKLPQAALRWHGRLELEASMMTLGESQLALAALARETNVAVPRYVNLLLNELQPTLSRQCCLSGCPATVRRSREVGATRDVRR